MPLFVAADLSDWLGRAVTEPRAEIVESVVWGWLKPALGVSDRPNPVPDEVFSWAIELAAIAHENPSGLSSKQLGPASQSFSLERRNEILEGARAGWTGGDAALSPRGSFPPAIPYPDVHRR